MTYLSNDGLSVSNEAILQGPIIIWTIDGKIISWAGHFQYLKKWQKFLMFFKIKTLDQIACEIWPHLRTLRSRIINKIESDKIFMGDKNESNI